MAPSQKQDPYRSGIDMYVTCTSADLCVPLHTPGATNGFQFSGPGNVWDGTDPVYHTAVLDAANCCHLHLHWHQVPAHKNRLFIIIAA